MFSQMLPDATRSRLRALVATIDREIALVPEQGAAKPSGGLLASWSELVGLLALGPEPEMRACPVCKRLGMREATLCGFCWTKLTPPGKHEKAIG